MNISVLMNTSHENPQNKEINMVRIKRPITKQSYIIQSHSPKISTFYVQYSLRYLIFNRITSRFYWKFAILAFFLLECVNCMTAGNKEHKAIRQCNRSHTDIIAFFESFYIWIGENKYILFNVEWQFVD